MSITKAQKKHLRALAGVAYERDLALCLNVLRKSYDKWDAGEISVWDVNDKIHEFHNGTARDLYKRYSLTGDPSYSVAFGVRQGVIDISEIDKECLSLIQPLLDHFACDDDR
ncbi:hypothetical protein ACFL2V_03910 [Pseudomonadota bacterium]